MLIQDSIHVFRITRRHIDAAVLITAVVSSFCWVSSEFYIFLVLMENIPAPLLHLVEMYLQCHASPLESISRPQVMGDD